MFKLDDDEVFFIGIVLEGFFYGLYSGIFIMYLQYQTSKEDTNKAQKIICYLMCALYVLSVAIIVCDILTARLLGKSLDSIGFIASTLFGCCDFIAQFILIYRCWIVWGRNIRVVIIPTILAFAFLGTWLPSRVFDYILSPNAELGWSGGLLLSSLTLSLAINVLTTGLIVFRIFKVFREVKATLDDQFLSATGGSKLSQIIFILIESGMTFFSIQFARLMLTNAWTDGTTKPFYIFASIQQMLNGITPTIIVVRTAMGLSFDEKRSMEEVAIESLRFESNHTHPTVPETGSIGIVGQDRRDDGSDDIGVRRNNDIDVVER